MNILTILGSPRKKGNTAGVLDMVEQELSGGHHVERLAITSVKVNGCLGCEACQKVAVRPGCVQKDDAVVVFERMMAADAVIYSSPLYCWDFSSQMKALIDRAGYVSKANGDMFRRKVGAAVVAVFAFHSNRVAYALRDVPDADLQASIDFWETDLAQRYRRALLNGLALGVQVSTGQTLQKLRGEPISLPGGGKYENIMDAARQLVDEDPKRVAQLVKTWMNEEAA